MEAMETVEIRAIQGAQGERVAVAMALVLAFLGAEAGAILVATVSRATLVQMGAMVLEGMVSEAWASLNGPHRMVQTAHKEVLAMAGAAAVEVAARIAA